MPISHNILTVLVLMLAGAAPVTCLWAGIKLEEPIFVIPAVIFTACLTLFGCSLLVGNIQ